MFAPVNTDHAITSAVFTVNFAEPLPELVFQAVQAKHDLWRPDLPAVRPANSLSIEVTPQGPVVHTGPGIDFAFLRPDGSPAWSLRIAGQELTVECTRYTRWDSVLSQAFSHLKKALTVATGVRPDIQVDGLSLIIQDDFFWTANEGSYDLNLLFKPSKLMSSHVFDVGPVWHSHTAWFENRSHEELPDYPTLVHFNVTGTRETPMAVERGAVAQVNIANLQNLRITTPMQISSLDADSDMVSRAFEVMHIRNKSILTAVLTEDVGKRIGLR